MDSKNNLNQYRLGLNIPAVVGMSVDEISTPALIIDLDAFEQNVDYLSTFCAQNHIRLRPHAKTHKSVDIARYQIKAGSTIGICCQKVSEAEVFVSGGIKDVLVSNQVVAPTQIDHLARLALKARIIICVDDPINVEMLGQAATKHNVNLECLVEIDVGAGRCGVLPGKDAVRIAEKIEATPGLRFEGLQAYYGPAQHVHDYKKRQSLVEGAAAKTSDTVKLLQDANFMCQTIGGAGTGSYYFESASGVFNELQCGSYVFMDADYQKVRGKNGELISEFRNSLFVYSTIMSTAKNQGAVCDAGLKALSVDSGLPVIYGRDDIEYVKCSDEHGQISDPHNSLRLNQKLKLIPGHCDPTCNLHDWYVGIRNNKVECLWPVSARGRVF